MASLECDMCLERLDAAARRPKVLRCAHTACLRCLMGDRHRAGEPLQCAVCGKETDDDPESLCDNLDRLYFLEQAANTKKFWCLECKDVANDECMEEHVLNRMQPSHHKQLKRAARLVRNTARLQRQTAEHSAGLAAAMQAVRRRQQSVLACPESLRTGVAATATAGAAPGCADEQPAEVIPELDMHALTQLCGASERWADKSATIDRITRCGVLRLKGVYCLRDPDWSEALLRAAAPRLEEVHAVHPRQEHLLAMHAAPALRRLAVWCDDATELFSRSAALPPGRPASLTWLSARLPRATLRSLLETHAASLRALRLRVGPPGPRPWPKDCDDLDALLAGCGLAALRSVVLLRDCFAQGRPACVLQLRAVRRALPGVEVLCQDCDGAPYEPF